MRIDYPLKSFVWDADAKGSPGLTRSDFDGISTETIRGWLTYWERVAAGTRKAEDGHDPVEAAEQARRELKAREEQRD